MRRSLSVILLSILAFQPASPASAATPNEAIVVLALANESKSSTYARSKFKHWIDADRDGCDTRKEVLLEESKTKIEPKNKCVIDKGQWLSMYDQRWVYSAASLDIDHLVPLKEAWESGASGWSAKRREAFANDLDFPESLIAVTASINRKKGDRDPSAWLPPATYQVCYYALAWVSVKYRWDLKADRAERNALVQALDTCPTGTVLSLPNRFEMPGTAVNIRLDTKTPNRDALLPPSPSPTPTQSPSPTPSPTPTQTSSSSIFAGKGWKIEIQGPSEFQRGQAFTIRIRVLDIETQGLPNKVVDYSGWYLSGKSSPTDTQGYTDVRITPTSAWNDITLNFSSDYALESWTIKVKTDISPTPTPSPSETTPTLRTITPGAFCKATEAGTQGVYRGVIYTCKTDPPSDTRLRWRR